jgi:hypothetical protein
MDDEKFIIVVNKFNKSYDIIWLKVFIEHNYT